MIAPIHDTSEPLVFCLTSPVLLLCYTMPRSTLHHNAEPDRMTVVHPHTCVRPLVHFLDYTMPRLVPDQVQEHDRSLPGPQQSGAGHGDRYLYQTMPWSFGDRAVWCAHEEAGLPLVFSSAAGYCLLCPRERHCSSPVPVRD